MNQTAKIVLVTGIGTVIGTMEALIYYNMGQAKDTGKFTYKFPPGKELLKTASVVLVTSFVTGALVSWIEDYINNRNNKMVAEA